MKSWFGSFYSSANADPIEVTVLAGEKNITIGFRNADGVVNTKSWSINDVQAGFDNSEQATRLTNIRDSGSKLIIQGKDALNFFQQIQEEKNKPWHKKDRTKEWTRNLTIFFIVAGLLVGAYLLVVPWISGKLAAGVSIQREEQFGNAVYNALDITLQEDKNATIVLNEFFKSMKIQTAYNVKITVVKGDVINAFALPGGNIVVYTALLQKLVSYPELAALLSHEFVHVNNKHSTRSIFRQLGSRIFLSLLFGKFGSVTSILIDKADEFKSLKYSRSLEKEADMQGLLLLKERGIDPAGFTGLFQQLKASTTASSVPEFLASHPDIENRIAYIQKAGKNSVVKENMELKTIFENLKQTISK